MPLRAPPSSRLVGSSAVLLLARQAVHPQPATAHIRAPAYRYKTTVSASATSPFLSCPRPPRGISASSSFSPHSARTSTAPCASRRSALTLGCRCSSHSASQRRQQQQHHQQYDDEEELRQRLRHARPLVPDALASKFAAAGRGRSSRALAVAAVAAAVAFYLFNSETVPVTGRRRFNFLSDALVTSAYSKAADQYIAQIEAQGGRFLSDNEPRVMFVKRVMKRLIPVSGMEDLDWEVFVIDDDRTANAFVTPGGKVFVHSGIINVCRNAACLAAVLGHEIAHNTASHAAERLSAAWVGNLTAGSLFFLAGAVPGLVLFGLWNLIGGFYLQEVLFYLPMGRTQESEADYIGLMMMAKACYDPREAVVFWERMEAIQKSGGQEVPEMLSTHPSHENRIAKIKEWMPEAQKTRAESDCEGEKADWNRYLATMTWRRPYGF